MFTGLVETIGRIISAQKQGGALRLAVDVSGLKDTPAQGASIAVNGACLTVTSYADGVATFDAVEETVSRTTLASLRPGDEVNLESALRAGDPLDGHIVQGHVDAVGELLGIAERTGSRVFRFSLPAALVPLVAEKGSVAVSGISLTVVEAGADFFTVSLIPETLRQTTLGNMRPGARVNLEADVLARYVARQQQFPLDAAVGKLSEAEWRAFLQ